MFLVIQHFGKHYSCLLEGKYVDCGHFWKSYFGQVVGTKKEFMVLIGGAEEWAAIQWEKSMW
jgi:hypothetical protein